MFDSTCALVSSQCDTQTVKKTKANKFDIKNFNEAAKARQITVDGQFSTSSSNNYQSCHLILNSYSKPSKCQSCPHQTFQENFFLSLAHIIIKQLQEPSPTLPSLSFSSNPLRLSSQLSLSISSNNISKPYVKQTSKKTKNWYTNYSTR
jgi:hypothetical protein